MATKTKTQAIPLTQWEIAVIEKGLAAIADTFADQDARNHVWRLYDLIGTASEMSYKV